MEDARTLLDFDPFEGEKLTIGVGEVREEKLSKWPAYVFIALTVLAFIWVIL